MPPLKNVNKVATAVAGSVVAVYLFWEVRLRASARAGKIPRTHTDVRFFLLIP